MSHLLNALLLVGNGTLISNVIDQSGQKVRFDGADFSISWS